MFSDKVKYEVVQRWLDGESLRTLQRQFGIKSDPTIYEWVRLYQTMGFEGLKHQRDCMKTNHTYSFKIEVINWRLENKASLPVTARHFSIRSPSTIWIWERALEQGLLRRNKGRPEKMTDKPKNDKDELKQVKEENEFLKVRVAYLEKLHALVQKKEKSQTKKKPE